MYRNTILAITITASSCIYAAPIHDAIENGETKQVKQILTDNKEALSQQDQYGYYPIHLAAKTGNTEILNILLDAGADPNRSAKMYPLHVRERQSTAKNDNGALVEALTMTMQPLHIAATADNMQAAKLLVQNGAQLDETLRDTTHHALFEAASNGNVGILQQLVKAGADLTVRDKNKQPLLPIAASHGNIETIQYLLEQGIDPNVQQSSGKTALMKLIGLLDKTKDDDVYVDDNDIIFGTAMLLRYGADPNIQTDDCLTALHIAAGTENGCIIDMLLKNGANPNVNTQPQEHDNQTDCTSDPTPLHIATLAGSKIGVQKLIEAGANVNAQAKENFTPLFWAVFQGHSDIAKRLIEAGAHVNARANQGITPLHIAAAKGHTQLVELLLKHNADTQITISEDFSENIQSGFTARDIAEQVGHTEIVKLLDKHHKQ